MFHFLTFMKGRSHSSVSDAPIGWAGWALAQPEIGSSVNPITTMGADYAHHITASPPGSENPAASQVLAFSMHPFDLGSIRYIKNYQNLIKVSSDIYYNVAF